MTLLLLIIILFPIVSFSEEGALKWAFLTGGDVFSSPAIGSDGTIYVGSDDYNLYAINPDGSQKWAFQTGGHVSSFPAISSDGTIYVGSYDDKLYAINGSSLGLAQSSWPMFHKNLQHTGRNSLTGDIDNDGVISIEDGIAALQLHAGVTPKSEVHKESDINRNGRIDVVEAIYALQIISGLRSHSPALDPIGNKSIDEKSELSFTLVASTADHSPMTYLAFNLPNGAIFDTANRTFSWTPTYSQAGTYDVTFIVTNSLGAFDSETVTITVNNKILSFVASDYFPLNIGDWQDFKCSSTGLIQRSYTTGPRYIGDVPTKERIYWDGQKDYYTSDVNGVKIYGQYVISPYLMGDIYFSTPLLLMPNNTQIGTTQVSNSTYSFIYSGSAYHVNITSTVTILELEDLVIGSQTLLDCIKVSVRYDQYVIETGQAVPGNTVYYWFYKGIGSVKQVVGSDTYTITSSYINGVQQSY